MPTALHVLVVPKGGGKVTVEHVFYAETDEEAQKAYDAHAAGCEFLTPAIAENRVEEELEDIDEEDWPDFADDEPEEEGADAEDEPEAE